MNEMCVLGVALLFSQLHSISCNVRVGGRKMARRGEGSVSNLNLFLLPPVIAQYLLILLPPSPLSSSCS